MIAYISGPMRGKPNFNYDQFNQVAAALYTSGVLAELFLVINPAANFGGDTTLPISTYMQTDIKQVLSADIIVLLPGWEKSEGSMLEAAVAKATGKQFYQAVPVGADWEFVQLDEPVVVSSPRAGVLDEARQLITGERNCTYGPPHADFQRTADAANAYGYRGPGGRLLAAHDVAILVSLVKISRLMWTPEKRDSWVDLAGYAACGWECVTETQKDKAA